MEIETITANPWFALASLVVTISSLIVAFIFYRKSRRDKTPCYIVTRQSIIENSVPLLPGLSVHLNGVVQEVITVAKVAFWNHGNETIVRQDIAEAKPLAIIVDEGVDVLNANVLKCTDKANQFQIGEPQKEDDGSTTVPISFDFLDRGDGALVQIVHNGEERTRIWVEGRIKGARNPLKQSLPTPDHRLVRRLFLMLGSRLLFSLVAYIYVVFGVGLFVIGIFVSSARPAIAFGCLFLLFSLLCFLMLGRKVPPTISPVDEESSNKSTSN